MTKTLFTLIQFAILSILILYFVKLINNTTACTKQTDGNYT